MKKFNTLFLISLLLSFSFGVFAKQKVGPAPLVKKCRGNTECITDAKEAYTTCEGSNCTGQFKTAEPD